MPRRRAAAAKTPPRLPRRLVRCLIAVLALLWLALALCWHIEDRFDPILDELAEYEGRAAAVQAVTDGVAAALAARPDLCVGLYALQYTGGTVTAVQADAAAMNAARLALVQAANTALDGMPPVSLMVPFGTLTGFSLLNRLGPGWPLSFQPEAFAEGEIQETTEAVAIDSTRYSAVLRLRITVNMVLDGKNRVLYAEHTVPLASVLAGGQVPLVYAPGGEK